MFRPFLGLQVAAQRQVLFTDEVGAGALGGIDLRSGRGDHVERSVSPATRSTSSPWPAAATARCASNRPPTSWRLSKGFFVIDPDRRAVVLKSTVGGHPEGFQIDPSVTRLLANIPDQRRIAANAASAASANLAR